MNKRPSQELLEQINKLNKEYHKISLQEFKAGFKEIFENNPRLKCVSWSSSYEYNDGYGYDFSSGHEDPHLNGYDPYDGAGDDDDLYTKAEEGDKEAKKIIKTVNDFLQSFPEEFYKKNFEEGATIDAKGVKTP